MELGEKSIKKMHSHPIRFFSFYCFGILLIIGGFIFSLPIAALGLLLFVLGEIFRRADTFFLLETGVAEQYKFLSTSRKFTEYDHIQNVEVNQSFIENLFKVGTVKIDTAGSDKAEIVFQTINNPYNIEKMIREKMKKP